MPANVRILGMRQKNKYSSTIPIINTCSNSTVDWQNDLSPFKLGPCTMYNHPQFGWLQALNMENAWQYSKVYNTQMNPATKDPIPAWWTWAQKGWADPIARRYPMGRGAVPEYSYWDGKKLGYIDARKTIYGPLYAKAVQATQGYMKLFGMYNTLPDLILRDFDGYDHDALNMSLSDVLNNPKRKMGHSFILKMLLTGDIALQQLK